MGYRGRKKAETPHRKDEIGSSDGQINSRGTRECSRGAVELKEYDFARGSEEARSGNGGAYAGALAKQKYMNSYR